MLKGRARELLAEVEDSAFLEGGVMRVKGELDEQPEGVEGKGKQCRAEAASARAGADLFRLRVEHCRHHRFHLKKGTEGHTFSVKLLSADDGRKDIITAVQEMCRKGVKPSDFTVDSLQQAIVGMAVHPHTLSSHAFAISPDLLESDRRSSIVSRFWRPSRPQPDAQV